MSLEEDEGREFGARAAKWLTEAGAGLAARRTAPRWAGWLAVTDSHAHSEYTHTQSKPTPANRAGQPTLSPSPNKQPLDLVHHRCTRIAGPHSLPQGMASTTPRPHTRHNSHSLVDDTPTRPPSGASFNTTTLTSLKPQRSAQHTHQQKMHSLGGYAGGQRAGLAQMDTNRAGGDRPNSRGSGFSLKASDLDGLGAGAGHADVIEADNTELARRRAEASFQREMEELRNARLSSTSGSSVDGEEQRNRRFDDESASSTSDASRSSASSFGSLKIGLTGTRTTAQHQSLAAALDDNNAETTDDNLTYMTIPRTDESPVASPARPAAPATTAAAPAPARSSPFSRAPAASTNLFASPRPFVSSAAATAGTTPLSSSPRPRPSSATNNENVPPARSASYPSIPPPRTSPFHSFSPAAPSPASAPVRSAIPHRPSPLGRNSPILAQNTTTTTGVSSPSFVARSPKNGSAQARSPLQSVQTSRTGGVVIEDYVTSSDGDDDRDNAANRSTRSVRTALPDKTGLTEFLRSPEKARSGVTPARRRMPAQAQAGQRGESGSSSEGRRSTEGASRAIRYSLAIQFPALRERDS